MRFEAARGSQANQFVAHRELHLMKHNVCTREKGPRCGYPEKQAEMRRIADGTLLVMHAPKMTRVGSAYAIGPRH